jgi:hypothetical protein
VPAKRGLAAPVLQEQLDADRSRPGGMLITSVRHRSGRKTTEEMRETNPAFVRATFHQVIIPVSVVSYRSPAGAIAPAGDRRMR